MKVKPTANWKLLGTDAELETQVEYEARWAQNQPGWQDERKLFVDHPEPIGFLLKQGDYVITQPDRPVDLERIECLLKQWMFSVDIPDNGPDTGAWEEGQLTVNDGAMLQLIEQTQACLADLKLTIKENE